MSIDKIIESFFGPIGPIVSIVVFFFKYIALFDYIALKFSRNKRRLAAALEIECPRPLQIGWNPHVELGDIFILESASRESVSHEWKFTLRNIKKENVRSLNVSWKFNFEIEELKKFATDNLHDFCRNASYDSIELSSEIRENMVTITGKKSKVGGEDHFKKPFFLEADGENEKINSIGDSESKEVNLPDGIVNSIIIYCLSLSNQSSKLQNQNPLSYALLPSITLKISYYLESVHHTKITQTIKINGKIRVWNFVRINEEPAKDLAALVKFDEIDYDKQEIEINHSAFDSVKSRRRKKP